MNWKGWRLEGKPKRKKTIPRIPRAPTTRWLREDSIILDFAELGYKLKSMGLGGITLTRKKLPGIPRAPTTRWPGEGGMFL